jgi:putative peptide zinc metalloprotease protein
VQIETFVSLTPKTTALNYGPPQMTAIPKLRRDLVIRSQTSGNGTTLVIKDPTARRFFRFGEVEHFVAQQLDGSTPLDVVRRRVEERFDRPLNEETLRRLVEQFSRFRLLDDSSERREDQHARRVRGSLLYLRAKVFDPDRCLDWLVARMNLVFTRTFVVASAVGILAALTTVAIDWPQFTADLGRLYRFDALLLAWVTVLSVTTVHEFAHGVTCKRFGGQVNEIGFLFLYFQPAFFCNVSDAWLIPEKSKRLWVTFAGAYSEMLVWSVATFAWRITETDTWINFVALVVMATSGTKSLFNLNPLIKLDGYYLLSDYLEIPNLRQKSVAALKTRARKVWDLSADAFRVRGREQWIYLAYGALASLYSTTLIGLIAWKFGGFLTTRYRGGGFIVFVALLFAVFRRPLGNILPKRQPAAADEASDNRRSVRAWRWPALALIGAATAVVPADLKVSGDLRILPLHRGDIRAQIDGILAEIYKDEGDRIQPGDAIARLDDRDYASSLQKIEAQLVEAQARRDLLRAGPRREEIDLARSELASAELRRQHGETMLEDASRFRDAQVAKMQTSVQTAEERLRFARNDLERVRTLAVSGLVSRQSVEQAEHEAVVLERDVEEARAAARMALSDDSAEARKERDHAAQEFSRAEGRLRVLLAGSRVEEIKAADAEIARLHAERAYVAQQLALARVVSPSVGVVATPRLKERRGERVSKGDLIAGVYDESMVTAEIMVSEKEISEVRVGQTVLVRARALPDRTFTSRITAIAPVAIDDPRGLGSRMVRVMTDIDNGSRLLKPEMTGAAKIYAGRRRMFELATRRIARYVRVEFWSWW